MTGTSARIRRAVAACLLAVALAGCASSPSGGTAANTPTTAGAAAPAGGSSTTGGSSSAVVITIKNFAFEAPASVSPGASITVRNEDPTEHTVTADSGNAFDDQVASGGSSTFTAPSQPGTYPFHCTIHPFMKGTLVVK